MRTKRLSRFGLTFAAIVTVSAGPGACTQTRNLANMGAALRQIQEVQTRLEVACARDRGMQRELIRHVLEARGQSRRGLILVDLDELLTPDGAADLEALDRRISAGGANALATEVRLGRLTVTEARSVLRDHSAAQALSSDMRDEIERRLCARFLSVERTNRMDRDLLAALDQRARAYQALNEENRALIAGLIYATRPPQRSAGPSPPPGALAGLAGTVLWSIESEEVGDSVAALLNELLGGSAELMEVARD